ncbi:hypothetical protein [Henriciella aquimarina]|uniref:hypothetical protein n=1 Tax=Henriciella aquimarina TaxID=545261 RepID=UPI000A0604BD|nr:hypothetical protein [Henriciella aquimarina]
MTDFKHFSLVAGGETVEDHQVPDGVVGPSVMSMKVWAETVEQAVDVLCEVGNQIGFKIDEQVEVHRTPAKQAVREEPFAYELRVIPCSPETLTSTVEREAETVRSE